jgi:hypothetical protein
VRSPSVFRESPPEELRALERWRAVCGEPLDHLEAAEELLDRMGELHGWRSPEALEAALLVKRLELPDENPWFVGKMAEAVVSFYAALEQHRASPQHPRVRGAIRRMERLMEMDRIAPGRSSASEEEAGRTGDLEASSESPGAAEPDAEEPDRAELRSSTRGPRQTREATQSAAQTPRGAEPHLTPGGAQESLQRPSRPGRRRGRLWRRVFGG